MCCGDEMEHEEKQEIVEKADSYSLSFRVAQLEKEMALVCNLVLIVSLAGLFFAIRWYQKEVSSNIAGVLS